MAEAITECAVCGKEIEVLDQFNGEMMCKACYEDPDNQVFED